MEMEGLMNHSWENDWNSTGTKLIWSVVCGLMLLLVYGILHQTQQLLTTTDHRLQTTN